ncbi:MAG: Bifunctional protein HldE [Chlamydiales bacterium]|nr:Bifunctional protein HldE [Chlamydiales bacterium]
MQEKIKQLGDIGSLVAEEKRKGHKVVHCHGVFDLLHPGHIRHLQEAKKQGDKLVVSITPDQYVNKGPGRPAFTEKLRLEQLASLVSVDYVVLNNSPDAVSVIKAVQPSVYIKGEEYRNHGADVTGKISEEAEAVQSVGGEICYTNDIVFSSSELLNRFFDPDARRLSPFLTTLKQNFSLGEILEKIESLKDLKVLVIGDAILDTYQYVDPLGQSGKGVHFTATLRESETFLGGSLVVANHLSSFVQDVTLLTGVGQGESFSQLAPNVNPEFIYLDDLPTLTKKRYVLKDGKTITKLFETYSSNVPLLSEGQTKELITKIRERAQGFDLVLVCDFGNGLINSGIIHALCSQPNFLAVNTQTNSGNRGYNVVTHYHRADFISLNEPELRLAAHDRTSRLETVVADISEILHCPQISVTRGVNGVSLYEKDENAWSIPALTMQSVDRVGAGDSYFALASLFAAKGYPILLGGFVGSVAAAIDIQIVGNKEAVHKVDVCKYITRLMK